MADGHRCVPRIRALRIGCAAERFGTSVVTTREDVSSAADVTFDAAGDDCE
jgi:hypothetical protein